MCESNQPVPFDTATVVPTKRSMVSKDAICHVIGGIARYGADIVLSMPELKDPKFDEKYLPENNANFVQTIAYVWLYNYRKFEYSVEPTRRGFCAWLRFALWLLFLMAFFLAFPILIFLVIAQGLRICITKFCGVFDATFELIKSILLVVLVAICVLSLAYLIYLTVSVILGKPIYLPSLHVVHAKKDTRSA